MELQDKSKLRPCDFECSECGESSEFTPGFMPNYCPHCGARVEEASDDADR